MKSLYESILSKSKVGLPANVKDVERLKGKYTFKGQSKEYGDVLVSGNKWTKVVFDDEKIGWNNVTAYFCKGSEWIIYHTEDASQFSAFSLGPRIQIEIKDFANFYDLLMDAATIPSFDKKETNLEM